MNHDLWNITRIWMVGETFEHDIHGNVKASQMYDVSIYRKDHVYIHKRYKMVPQFCEGGANNAISLGFTTVYHRDMYNPYFT